MMKFIGALLFITTSSWIGFDLSKQLSRRTIQIRQLIQSIQLLETEMSYSQLTLQHIFQIISKKTDPPISLFYKKLAEDMEGIVTDFITVWDEAITYLQQSSDLKQRELEVLKQFGRNLGQHTFTEQQKHIVLTIHHLQHELKEANERRQQYEKMTKSLGVLIGILIVLLLI